MNYLGICNDPQITKNIALEGIEGCHFQIAGTVVSTQNTSLTACRYDRSLGIVIILFWLALIIVRRQFGNIVNYLLNRSILIW